MAQGPQCLQVMLEAPHSGRGRKPGVRDQHTLDSQHGTETLGHRGAAGEGLGVSLQEVVTVLWLQGNPS